MNIQRPRHFCLLLPHLNRLGSLLDLFFAYRFLSLSHGANALSLVITPTPLSYDVVAVICPPSGNTIEGKSKHSQLKYLV